MTSWTVNDPHFDTPRYRILQGHERRVKLNVFPPVFFFGDDEVIHRTWGRGFMYIKNNYNYNNVFGYQTKNWRWDEFLSVFLGKQNGKMRGLMRGLKTQLPDPKKTPWHPWWKQGRITVVPKMPGQIQGYGWVWVPQSEVWGRYAKLLIARVDIHPVLLDLCNT